VNLQAPELLIILVVILLLFGSTKLPKLARSLGQAQKEFKDGIKDGSAEGGRPATGSPSGEAPDTGPGTTEPGPAPENPA
jgi:sec-independent protein translocase protein TatA